jgi:hypothetical protein
MTTYNFFRIFVLLAAVTLAAALLALAVPLGQAARAQVISPEATLVGAGDIASCRYNRDYKTAMVVNNTIATASAPVTIFTLGDNAYPDGTTARFSDCYDPTWGEATSGSERT